MASGVPVACSRAPGLSEVAGEAALTFDPTNVDEMTGVIQQLVSDEPLRETFREKGIARAATFSWAETARLTLEAYRTLVVTL
jgi:alpha-1,3-rhamnosyl/mannosyltransferase